MTPQGPIIVKIIQPDRDPLGIAGVIVQAIGFTGAVSLLAIVLGLCMAGFLFWMRSRTPLH